MQIALFDAHCGFGGATPGDTTRVSADELAAEMQRLGIARALVRIVPEEMDSDIVDSSAQLSAACASHPFLLPCPVVVPNGGEGIPSEDEQIAQHARQGAGAVWIRPAADYWSLAEWASGPLFRALARRRMPVLVVESVVNVEQVGALAGAYPELRLLLAGASYRQQRVLRGLLRSFPNVYVVLGGAYCVHGGLEQFAAEFGAARVLFGTGFPRTEAMAAITYLMYSGLSEEEKQLIGSGNLERLLGEVER